MYLVVCLYHIGRPPTLNTMTTLAINPIAATVERNTEVIIPSEIVPATNVASPPPNFDNAVTTATKRSYRAHK